MDEAWLNYHRCWAARNPECIKRYRKASKLRKAETDLQSSSFRHQEYWQLRDKFERKGNMAAVVFSQNTKDDKPEPDDPGKIDSPSLQDL